MNNEGWGAYPATTSAAKPKARASSPYNCEPPKDKPKDSMPICMKQTQPEVVIINKTKPAEVDKDMEMADRLERIVKSTPVSEITKEKRTRRTAPFMKYNIYEDIKNKQANVTIEELLKIPTIYQQFQKAVKEVQFADSNSADTDTGEEDIKTSAYTTCQVEDRMFAAIVDTGAGYCFMAKKAADLLGWNQYKPTKLVFVTTDGKKCTPLGRIADVPIRFGGATVSTDVIITKATNYDLILGNDWLETAQAKIDIAAQKMTINPQGKEIEIDLNIRKGFRIRHDLDMEIVEDPVDQQSDEETTSEQMSEEEEEEEPKDFYVMSTQKLENEQQQVPEPKIEETSTSNLTEEQTWIQQ